MSPVAPVLVLAIGNESRGDDALGPLLARNLQDWLAATGRAGDVEIIEEFQLQIENSLDMVKREKVLFIDAGHKTRSPFLFYEAEPKHLQGHTTHAVAPETLLGIFADVHKEPPPSAFILCVAGESFELGASLSKPAAEHLEHAAVFCKRLFEDINLQAWRNEVNYKH